MSKIQTEADNKKRGVIKARLKLRFLKGQIACKNLNYFIIKKHPCVITKT